MPTLHIVLLGAFLVVTTLLLVTSSGGLKRAADVELFWRDVRSHSLPVGPVIFSGLMVLLLASSIVIDLGIHPVVPAGYLAGGIFWLIASVLTPAVVVTHHGVIVRQRQDRHRVAWRQIVDYFQFETDRKSGVVLLYADRGGRRRRVEVTVPVRHREHFERLLSEYLDSRLEHLPQETYGGSTLEG